MVGELERRTGVVRRAGGWFAIGESWSGPWKTPEAAKLAREGDFDGAQRLERERN